MTTVYKLDIAYGDGKFSTIRMRMEDDIDALRKVKDLCSINRDFCWVDVYWIDSFDDSQFYVMTYYPVLEGKKGVRGQTKEEVGS